MRSRGLKFFGWLFFGLVRVIGPAHSATYGAQMHIMRVPRVYPRLLTYRPAGAHFDEV